MNVEALAPFLAGPGAAVIVLLCVFAALYRLAVAYLIPLASAGLDRHLQQFDDLNVRMEDQQTKRAEEHGRILSISDAILSEVQRPCPGAPPSSGR